MIILLYRNKRLRSVKNEIGAYSFHEYLFVFYKFPLNPNNVFALIDVEKFIVSYQAALSIFLFYFTDDPDTKGGGYL